MCTSRLLSPRRASCVALLLAATLGCEPASEADDTAVAPPDTGTDSGDTWPDATFFSGFQLTPSELIPTVVTASWQTEEPALCSLAFGPEGDLDLAMVEDGEPSTEHEVVLVGVPAETAASLVVSVEIEGHLVESDAQSFTTGALPSEVPTMKLESFDDDAAFHGFTLVPVINAMDQSAWICIFDKEGELVWALEEPRGAIRARLAPDGGGIVYIQINAMPDAPDAFGGVVSVAWDGSERWRVERNDLHHDFAILGADRYVVLGRTSYTQDPGLPSERELTGDTLLEFGSSGELQEVWNVFDDLDPGEIYSRVDEGTSDDPHLDWSHANYITWDPDAAEVLVSLREVDAIVAVDIDVGAMTWSLSNDWGTYQAAGDPVLAAPHSVELVDGGLSVFNQDHKGATDACSWGAQLALDAGQGTATTTWSHRTDECVQVVYLGNTQPLPNGDELVVFSQAGVMDEVTPDGEVVRRMRSPGGTTLAYAFQTAELVPAAY